MTYLSPVVRTIRDDPVPGASVTLLLDVDDDADVERVAEAAREFGTVEAELAFETLEVTVSHERVADVCALDGISSIETANTLGIDPDGAGEDVEFE